MAERVKRIQFQATIEFEGSIEEYRRLMGDLESMADYGLKIGTWPTPEHPTETMKIGTYKLPEGPYPGIFPFARLFTIEYLMGQTVDMPRLTLIKDIWGGIRNPHLHLGDEIVLLDRDTFKDIVQETAARLTEGLAENAEYNEVADAITHLVLRDSPMIR